MPTALVTGANRGFGLALCSALHERGRDVVAACRRSSPELDALGVPRIEGIDLLTDAGEQALAAGAAGLEIDLLVANAGFARSTSLDDLDLDAIREQFNVNALGTLRTVRATLPSLIPGAKMALISSLAGSIGDNGAGGEYGYRMSKAALNMAGVSLARDLAAREIAVGVYHPGRLAAPQAEEAAGTEPKVRMPLSPNVADPLVAARELLDLVERLDLESSGRFTTRHGETIPW
jgi:NAD(P)-dependent dehydrogenase (short-subunit alcohol dehydrogenase family)